MPMPMQTMWRVLLLLLLAACTPAPKDTGTEQEEGTFRVAFIADTHVIGPQYVCCSESEGIDNESIMKTEARLLATRDRINAITPPPDLVFVLGDVVHNAMHGDTLEWYLTEDNAYAITADILAGFEMPVYPLWGNHDYEVDCAGDTTDRRALTHEILEALFGSAPYAAVDHKGWRFLLSNSQLGPTWSAGDPQCETGMGSFGAEQLAWIDAQLSEGLPTIHLSHHYLLTIRSGEDAGGPNPDLETVLSRHDNLKVAMAGHAHRWIDVEAGTTNPFRQVVLGATRYDDDNFWLMELEVGGEELAILDYDKPRYFTPCADTWRYEGTPVLEVDAVETGDCGD